MDHSRSEMSQHSERISKLAEYVQLNLAGFQNLRNKSYSEAIKNYSSARQLADDLDDKIKLCESLINLGVCYYFTGEFKSAKEEMLKANEISHILLDDEKDEYDKTEVKLWISKAVPD